MDKVTKTVKPRKRRLKTISDCIRANSDVWNRLNRDELKPEIATKLRQPLMLRYNPNHF